MRVGAQALARARDADALHQLDGAVHRLRLADLAVVDADLLDDLARRSGRPGPASSSDPGRPSRSSRRGSCCSSRSRRRQQLQCRRASRAPRSARWDRASGPSASSRVTDLPEPDSPTIASTSPRCDRERDAVDGAHEAVLGRERDAQVLDLEQRARAGRRSLRAGSAGRGTRRRCRRSRRARTRRRTRSASRSTAA